MFVYVDSCVLIYFLESKNIITSTSIDQACQSGFQGRLHSIQ